MKKRQRYREGMDGRKEGKRKGKEKREEGEKEPEDEGRGRRVRNEEGLGE